MKLKKMSTLQKCLNIDYIDRHKRCWISNIRYIKCSSSSLLPCFIHWGCWGSTTSVAESNKPEVASSPTRNTQLNHPPNLNNSHQASIRNSTECAPWPGATQHKPSSSQCSFADQRRKAEKLASGRFRSERHRANAQGGIHQRVKRSLETSSYSNARCLGVRRVSTNTDWQAR